MHTLWTPSSSRFHSLARTHALYGHSLHGFYCLNHTLSAFFDSSSFEFYRILILHCTRSNGNGIIFCHIRAYLVGNAKVCKKDILSHPGIYYNEEFEHDNMFRYDILCRALNRNILSHHALPQNIINMIFVNLLLQKCDKVCFAFTATCKFTSRHTASHQGMSTSHWGSDSLKAWSARDH